MSRNWHMCWSIEMPPGRGAHAVSVRAINSSARSTKSGISTSLGKASRTTIVRVHGGAAVLSRRFCTNTRSSQRRKLCAYPADATGNRKAQLRVHFDRGRVLRVYSPNHHVLTRGASSGDKLFDDLAPNPAPLGILTDVHRMLDRVPIGPTTVESRRTYRTR